MFEPRILSIYIKLSFFHMTCPTLEEQTTVLYTILYPPLSCTHPPTFGIFWRIFTSVGSTGGLVH